MIIKVCGTGCINCQKLEKNVRAAVAARNLDAEIIKVSSFQDMMFYDIAVIPALIINEKVVSYGKALSVPEVEKLLVQALAE